MNWPIKHKQLPSTEGTVLARRLVPPIPKPEDIAAAILFIVVPPWLAYQIFIQGKPWYELLHIVGLYIWLGVLAVREHRKRLKTDTLAKEFHDPGLGWFFAAARSLAGSPHELESDHALLGKFRGTEIPNLVQFSGLLNVGCLIQGAINSGKTMRAMLALVIQVLMRGKATIIFIDMKLDRLLMKCMMALAAFFSVPFLCLSNSMEITTNVYNIFRDSGFRSMSPAEKAEFFNQFFGLERGGNYGDSFFAGVARTLIAAIFKYKPDVGSWREMYAVAMDGKFRETMKINAKDIKDATEAINTIRELAELPQINVTDPAVPQIDIGHAMMSTMVIYFALAPSVGEVAARTIGRMAARLVYAVARSRGEKGPHVFLFIDEINVLLQRTIDFIIKQARDCRVSVIASMQNLSDAKTQEKDYTDSLTANLPVKITFTAMDDSGRKRLASIGGTRLKIENARSHTTTEGATGKGHATSVSTRELETPWFGPDEIELLNSTRELAIIEASPDTGFTRLDGPQFITFEFPLPEALVESIRATEWPAPNGVTTFLGSQLGPKPIVAKAIKEAQHGLPSEETDNDDEELPPPPVPVTPPKPKTPPPVKVRGRKKSATNSQFEAVLKELQEIS